MTEKCPFCEYESETEHGIRIHSSKKHGESLRKEKECEWCDGRFEYKESHEEQRRFCSIECKGEHQSENWTGEDSPRWNDGKEDITCELCGDKYKVAPNKVEGSRFCSRGCFGEWKQNNWTGENGPNWKGGYNLYVNGWRENREKAIKRDSGTCQVCGSEDDIHVHHIEPVVNFSKDNKSKHDLSNLICLCSKCHPKVENGDIECPNPSGAR